ncbi:MULTISPECIES: phosphoenolpyruvate carboxylase [unclassified Acidisoma]|jgi:phosphoenolpyruvate carboxylase|uniref:phosphoenolpyruvate carboxylase n=1 Tax=unclassified Acidisoma TaxID=2634065 RepID=UPI00131B8734|nr:MULTISPECIES: phosphoenolpyruvate carboxylase [unclassified Acidisoma]
MPDHQTSDPTLADPALGADALAEELLSHLREALERGAEDPFSNPVMTMALTISRRIDQGLLDEPTLHGLVCWLRDEAFRDRAKRIAAYVGLTPGADPKQEMAQLAARVVRPDPADSAIPFAQFRRAVERTRFSAVFTAHPTFSLPAPISATLAEAASGRESNACFTSHRPAPITLEEEFAQAHAAIARGRDAIDTLTGAILDVAQTVWNGRWLDLAPRPITLATWVGYDTDGRTDIGWWDTLRLRLRMKLYQLQRVEAGLLDQPGGQAILERARQAITATMAQLGACPSEPEAEQVAAFAQSLVGEREAALTSPEPLLALFPAAIAAADEAGKRALLVVRAGLVSHGLGLAHTHVRLNSAQLHNAVRQRLGLADPPADPSRRRVLLGAINTALETVKPEAINFGTLMAEQASAARLMMTVAQMVKHIDAVSPVRFLIAETETGYTLLSALYFARLFGIEKHVEISPLFETAEALAQGGRIIEEALRSPHYRAYLRGLGRLCVQFGYSDSGRYVGQVAATYLIERLRLKLCEAMVKHGLRDVEIVLFDTHGESIGRGAHPASMHDRLSYLSPAVGRRAFESAGIAFREESAFQGGDGYLLFGTPELAHCTILRVAEFAMGAIAEGDDPIYADPDFAADFFATMRSSMEELVEDPGYAAMLGAFGPALIDRTGSRPAARQSDGASVVSVISHPRELRAIPNNAILQQLGWCANTLQGLGLAVSRHPDAVAELRRTSPRFRRALDLATHGLAHSHLDVLRAVVETLDPGIWLDRAGHSRIPGRREALIAVAGGLERLGIWAEVTAMFRRIQSDHLALRAAWPEAPAMAERELLLHTLRLACIHRIWILTATIPDFAPRMGVMRGGLQQRLLRLDVPAAMATLERIFPSAPDDTSGTDFGEPGTSPNASAYAREHAEIFRPIHRYFALVREISAAVSHEVGAFG